MTITRTLARLVCSLGVLLGLCATARALPSIGSTAPAAQLEDANGKSIQMDKLRGRLALIVYEDKHSSGQNKTLIRELKKQSAKLEAGAPISFVPVADVTGYNFWPLKGFAKGVIRKKAEEGKYPIFCDWDGAFRSKYKLQRGASNIVLVGRDGRVLFAESGTLSATEQDRLFSLLTSELAAAPKSDPAKSQASRD